MLRPKKKLTRKQIKEDKLVTFMYKVTDWFNHYNKIVAFSAIGLVVVVVIGYMIIQSKSEANLTASGRLILGVEQYHAQNYDQAIPRLLEVIEQFKGTPNAGVACYYLANIYYFNGNYAEAKKYFSIYLDDYNDDPMFSSTSLAGLAACYAQEGNRAKAAQLYLKAANKAPESFTAAAYLFSAAQNYISIEQKSNAKKLLQQIIDQYSSSESANEAKLLLAELTSNS